jgi:hypothetical protein
LESDVTVGPSEIAFAILMVVFLLWLGVRVEQLIDLYERTKEMRDERGESEE